MTGNFVARLHRVTDSFRLVYISPIESTIYFLPLFVTRTNRSTYFARGHKVFFFPSRFGENRRIQCGKESVQPRIIPLILVRVSVPNSFRDTSLDDSGLSEDVLESFIIDYANRWRKRSKRSPRNLFKLAGKQL